MSTISNVSSTANPYPAASQSSTSQLVKDFGAIGSALQSGNLTTAQSALATFQQDLQNSPQTSANQPFGNNSQANTDLQSLANALQTGDLSGAQKAFTSLQGDLKATHKGHHHHGAKPPQPTTPTPTATTDSTLDTDTGSLNVTA